MPRKPKNLTKRQAELCLQALLAEFADAIMPGQQDHLPVLHRNTDDYPGRWEIRWEEGPQDWAYRALRSRFSEEKYYELIDGGMGRNQALDAASTPPTAPFPADKAWVEPINHFSIALLPN